MKNWVETAVGGEDETYDPIIASLNQHCKIMTFDKFKLTCQDDGEKARFLTRVEKAKPTKDVPALDETQLGDME